MFAISRAAEVFDETQVSTHAQLATVYYVVGLIAIMLAIAGVFMFDAGLSRRGNVLHTLTQKLGATVVGGAAMAVAGFAIWDIQFTRAFAQVTGTETPVRDALADWWILGDNINTWSQRLDYAAVPDAEAFQAFYAIFIIFGAFFAALLAGSVIERVRTGPLLVVAAVFAGLVIPVGGFLVYGPVGPLSNAGTHDFGGAFFYILLGSWALVLVWRAGARPGALPDTPVPEGPPVPHSMPLVVLGLLLFLAGLCGYVLLNGFLVEGAGFFGIAGNETGMGIILTNLMVTLMASGVGGLAAWRLTGNLYFFLVSPIAGWIGASAAMDVVDPWQCAIIAVLSPFVVVGGYRSMTALRLDDVKIVPLTLGPAIFGVLATGVMAAGTAQGGYVGLGGDYAPLAAEIGLGQQLLGVLAFALVGLISAVVVIFAVEKTWGIRDRRIDEGQAAMLDIAVLNFPGYAGEFPGEKPSQSELPQA